MKNKSESGAVFVYILLAIALFAGLSYAISNNSRSNVSLLDEEQAKLSAQEIIDYGSTVANAVQKLKLRGCKDTEISFEDFIRTGTYINPNSPADELCHIKYSSGSINSLSPNNKNWLDTSHVGKSNFGNSTATGAVFVTGLATAKTELIIYTPYVKKTICANINTLLNIDASLSTPDFTGGGIDAFVGDYTPSAFPEIGDENTALAGKTEFCFLTTAGHFTYMKILLAR